MIIGQTCQPKSRAETLTALRSVEQREAICVARALTFGVHGVQGCTTASSFFAGSRLASLGPTTSRPCGALRTFATNVRPLSVERRPVPAPYGARRRYQ